MMRMLTAGAVALALLGGGDWPGPQISEERRALWERACATYENRARFLPRAGTVEFVVAMAEGCRVAQESLATAGPAGRRKAAVYLDRLLELRDTLIAMNTERLYGRDPSPRARPRTGGGPMRQLAGVSRTGEVLIAHRMGLLEAFDSWRAEVPGFTLALGH